MNATAERTTMQTMPTRPPMMTVAELKRLIKAAGLAKATKSEVARRLGFSRSHLYRWLNGETVIDEGSALIIRARLQPKSAD
jgi:DNA invertase Pin-like site-specific DNA recombinase